jgi:two-component system copper resistance phosphate regulon response regulator CusR
MLTKKEVLILEDNYAVSIILQRALEKHCNVTTAKSINKAKKILKERRIDLLCLDLILPDGNGIDFCAVIKNELPHLKVIVLTKKTNIDTRLSCFDIGADDYLPKPFFPQELVARVNKLLRANEKRPVYISYKGLELNIKGGILTYKGSVILLSANELLLLSRLIPSNEEESDKSSIRYLSTGSVQGINPKALAVCMNRLRAKLKRNIGMQVIKTRYAKGYYIGI